LKKNDILLEIEDNGKGFEVAKVDTKQHHGIIGCGKECMHLKELFLLVR